jgi:hypothetical protein
VGPNDGLEHQAAFFLMAFGRREWLVADRSWSAQDSFSKVTAIECEMVGEYVKLEVEQPGRRSTHYSTSLHFLIFVAYRIEHAP